MCATEIYISNRKSRLVVFCDLLFGSSVVSWQEDFHSFCELLPKHQKVGPHEILPYSQTPGSNLVLGLSQWWISLEKRAILGASSDVN